MPLDPATARYVQRDWLFLEDKALKAKLQGINVLTNAGTEDVDVWFRLPQRELRDVRYPFVTIDLIGVTPDPEREHRNTMSIFYVPYGAQDPTTNHLRAEFPTPYNLDYQITTWARHALHDRSITAALMRLDRIPHRFGYLEIPEDNTRRYMYLLGGPVNADVVDQNDKRSFRKVFTVRVESELFVNEVGLVSAVQRVQTNITRSGSPVETVVVTEA